MADTWSLVIRDALLEIGVKEPGEALEADEEADGFRRLKGMFDEWGLEGLLVPGLQTITHTFTAGSAGPSFTFGPAATPPASDPDIVTSVEMEEIASFNFRRYGQERSRPLDPTSYAVISELRASYRYWPTHYYFDAAHPVSKIWFDGESEPRDFVEISGRGHFSGNIELTDNPGVMLPRGYREPVLLNLALKLGPSYGAKGGRDAAISDDTRRGAYKGKVLIQTRNLQVVEAKIDPALRNHSTSLLSRRERMSGW